MPKTSLKGIHLAELRASDAPTLMKHLQSRKIYEQTLRIPWPYTLALAQDFLNMVRAEEAAHRRRVVWAIRLRDETLAGVIGLESAGLAPGAEQAEVGYWVGEAYWNRGIATEALTEVASICFSRYGLKRLVAGVFPANMASRRVLEKCGFKLAGLRPGAAVKEGRPLDLLQYTLSPCQ